MLTLCSLNESCAFIVGLNDVWYHIFNFEFATKDGIILHFCCFAKDLRFANLVFKFTELFTVHNMPTYNDLYF